MTKEIKKYYNYLDLPYNATEEEVKTNEKAKIKVLRAKAIKYGKDYSKVINKIAQYSENLLEHIKKNGVGVERQTLKPTLERVSTLFFVLVLFVIVFVSSLMALL